MPLSARDGAAITLRRVLFLSIAALIVLSARAASAHALGLSRGEYTLESARVRAEIALRGDEAALAVPGLDADGDGHVTAREMARARAALQAAFVDGLSVEGDGARCPGTLDDAVPDAADGLRLHATYSCPHAPARLRLRFGFLDRMPADHRHLATIHLPRGDVDSLAVLARPDVEVDTGSTSQTGFGSLLRGGVEHILSGADHLAFLLALVLGATILPATFADAGGAGRERGSRRARAAALLTMLTAFTVGHSASLAIATLGGFAPGARWVEPAVALSVAYVGAENLFARGMRHRWALTLPFGFVHGFAFAGGLIPLGLPRAELPLALLAFNLGVEGGQVLVLAALLPPLALFARRPGYPRIARAASVAIAIAGVVWFVERVVWPPR